jgi:predicted transcriptional regulator
MPVTKDSTYNTRFNMVMLPEERAMLQALAREAGLKESDILRQMIRRDYVEQFGAKKPGKPKPAKHYR